MGRRFRGMRIEIIRRFSGPPFKHTAKKMFGGPVSPHLAIPPLGSRNLQKCGGSLFLSQEERDES